ncbi:hypothetical protein KVR01_012025 [Diaporthe batatas]|uniref:uncharacterized protein n=1 Tax=Diaporthe batatas TaxID=748121 RepID=UPI001D0562F4|nr:uncharacterized protein KVR01_012025 [Diaporthe batatas]KAG8158264.1 hypothetical protein KVR01_012025 [Diaporthe batatas]
MSPAGSPDGPSARSPEVLWQLVQFKKIKAFNDENELKQGRFECWFVIELPPVEDSGFRVWIVVVSGNAHARFPTARDECSLRVKGQTWWEASRVPNPTTTISIPGDNQCVYSTYKVKVPRSLNDDRQPLFAPLEMAKDPEDGALRPIFCSEKMLRAGLCLKIKSTPQLEDQIQRKAVPDPCWQFHDPKQYDDIFRWGTEEDFEFEAAEIRNFNLESVYKCWLVAQDTHNGALSRSESNGAKRHQYLVVMAVREIPEDFPKVGDLCELAFKSHIPAPEKDAATTKDNAKLKRKGLEYQVGARLDNPYDKILLDEGSAAGSSWNNYCTFKVSLCNDSAEVYSLLDGVDCKLDWRTMSQRDGRQKHRMVLDRASAFEAHVWIRISTTTMTVELNALTEALDQPVHSRTREAISYVRTFERTTETFDLFQALPNIRSDRKLPENVSALFQRLDEDQKHAYRTVLSKLPARVGILPGGPGTGKTSLFLAISSLALTPIEGVQKTGGPILLILEANRPANAAATHVVQHFEKLQRSELRILRAYNFNYEGVWSARKYLKQEDSDTQSSGVNFDEMFEAHRPDHVPQLRRGRKGECLAPNLKEAAQQYLSDHLEDFPRFSELLRAEHPAAFKNRPSFDEDVREEWDKLFKIVLGETDFVITTTVGAAKIAKYFRPTLVLFDEASRSRELGTLAAITNFPSAEAFLFTGTVEMTKPYLASHGSHLWNPCTEQLRTSMMARYLHTVPDTPRLSLNHQAYGNLHRLSSELFWDGGIHSALPREERFPPSTMHLLHYCRDLAGNQALTFPRLLVHVSGFSEEDFKQRSKLNKRHLNWVVQKIIRDLVQDPDFRSTDGNEPGSIIVTTPYRAQFTLYRKAINSLMRDLDREHQLSGSRGRRLHREVQVQPATADVVQGHSGDVVILDLVNWENTPHVADPNRLCAALTRAKQAEFVIMERTMLLQRDRPRRWNFGYIGPHIRLLHEHCDSLGQVIAVDPVDDSQSRRSYSLHRADPPAGADVSAVPRQLPELPPDLDQPREDGKAEELPDAAVGSGLSASDGNDEDGDVEDMLGLAAKFGFEMVRKAMQLGLDPLAGSTEGV